MIQDWCNLKAIDTFMISVTCNVSIASRLLHDWFRPLMNKEVLQDWCNLKVIDTFMISVT